MDLVEVNQGGVVKNSSASSESSSEVSSCLFPPQPPPKSTGDDSRIIEKHSILGERWENSNWSYRECKQITEKSRWERREERRWKCSIEFGAESGEKCAWKCREQRFSNCIKRLERLGKRQQIGGAIFRLIRDIQIYQLFCQLIKQISF